MSSQRGNVKKTGPPKHKNKTAFKNTLHDTNKRSLDVSNLHVTNCCKRCTDIIEWKIKYKKYKPLPQPKKCTLCQEKTVKKAYTLICLPCAQQAAVCIKCGEKNDDIRRVVELTAQEEARQQSQLQAELQQLTERQRRTFHRFQQKGQPAGEYDSVTGPDRPNDDSIMQPKKDSDDTLSGDDGGDDSGDDVDSSSCDEDIISSNITSDLNQVSLIVNDHSK